MKRIALLFVVACSKPADGPKPQAPRSSPALNALMKNEVNPTFSKLAFLVFHADTQDDPDAAQREIAAAAEKLASATQTLSTWPDPPVESNEGRDVFHTYATSVNADAHKLVSAVSANDNAGSARALERIAQTCNNCHHFFRLKIEDSVVGK